MKYYDLNNPFLEDISLNIKKGNVIVIYTDKGPGGIYGQSMNITCPHEYIYIFDNYDDYELNKDKIGRNGIKKDFRICCVGEFGSTVLCINNE